MNAKLLKKIAFLVAIFSLFSQLLSAQNQHIVGDGTIETAYPPNTQFFSYNWSSMLYTSAELGDAKTVTKIAFDQTTDYTGYWEYAVLENQKVYMKMVSQDAFGTLAYEDPTANGYTLVFDGTIQFNLSWTEIELIAPFEYDGTSSIIVHYENSRGVTAPIINVKFNSTTTDDGLFKACGGDAGMPTEFGTFISTRPNIALYYAGTGSATPGNPSPANNSFKALVDTDLEFIIGENTASFDLYFGENNPPNTIIASDIAVSSTGTYSVNPADILGDLLDEHTKYYWQVVAKDGSATTPSQIWNLTTQGVIEDFPYFTSFEDDPINPMYADTIDWFWKVAGPANWHMFDYNQHSGSYAVGCQVWTAGTDTYPLITPRMYLPENQRINVWWMMANGDGTGIDAFLDISTDGGENWTELKQFEFSEAMEEYEQLLLNLDGYSGDNVYIRWRYETVSDYVPEYFLIDDLTIEDIPSGSVIQIEDPEIIFPPLSLGATTYFPLEIKNIGIENMVIDGSTVEPPFSVETPITIAPGETGSVDITFSAATIGNVNQSFQFTGNFSGSADVFLYASVYQISYNFFENADVSLNLPEHWSVIRTADPYDIYTTVDIQQTNYDAYSAPNAFRMMKMNDTVSPLMLITEGVGGFGVNKLTFYAKKSYDSYDAELVIGTTNDPLHAEAFTAIETFEMTADYQKYEVEFPATNLDPYIAFSFIDGTYASAIWIDDISWDITGSYPPYCPVMTLPEANMTDVDIMTGLQLKWTSGGGNPTGYKLYLGTNPDANNILNGEDVGNVISYDFPVAPQYGTQYFWKVEAYNNYGASQGCGSQSFTTMQNPVVYVPWQENFDNVDAFGSREYPLGWSVENTNGDNFPWDLISDVATPGVAHSSPNAMHVVFSLNEMSDWLFTVPMNLNKWSVYELEFWYRTMGDSWVPNPVERMRVEVGDANNSVSMTQEIYSNEMLDNQEWEKATVQFSVENGGEYFIGFYGFSSPNQGLLLLDDVSVDILQSKPQIEENSVSIYPNPASSQMQVVAESRINDIKIYNISGALVSAFEVSAQQTAVDVQNLLSGIYMMQINTENGIIRKKIVVK